MYFVEKSKGIDYTRHFDYPLFIAVLLLTGIGLFVLHSATRVMPNNINGNRLMTVQIAAVCIGIVIAVVMSIFDYKDFKNLGAILYVASVLILVYVLFRSSEDYRGVIDLGPVSFQPAELAKTTFIIFISVFLERISEGTDRTINIIKLIIYAAIPFILVLAHKDFGTAIVFMFVFCCMIFICGIKYRYIIWAFIASLPAFVVMWLFILEPFQKDRILALFTAESGAQTFGFNLIRAKMAIGSGQLFGKGLYRGIQNMNLGVPVKESDFIFTVVGEELGFVGSIAIIAIITFILLRCLYIAKNSRDKYGSFLVIGVTGMLGFHYIENIGMCIGLLPVTGIPMPFISSGGSALVSYYLAIGLVLSVSLRRKKTIFNSSQ